MLQSVKTKKPHMVYLYIFCHWSWIIMSPLGQLAQHTLLVDRQPGVVCYGFISIFICGQHMYIYINTWWLSHYTKSLGSLPRLDPIYDLHNRLSLHTHTPCILFVFILNIYGFLRIMQTQANWC